METTRFLVVVLFISVCLFVNYCKSEKCDLKGASEKEKKLLDSLTKLNGKQYQTNDTEFTYYFAVCDVPDKVTNKSSRIGIYQDNGKDNGKFGLGRLTDVDLEGGELFMRLTYKDGDKYANSCNKSSRKAIVYIICDYEKKEKFTIIEENNKREDDCGYLFQLETSAICPERPKDPSTTVPTTAKIESKQTSSSQPSGLGIFGIVMSCIFSLFAVYFIIGFMYMRFIRQARGWQQMPNFRFWNKVGNMQADMCDYVCRCGGGDNDLRAQPYESLTGQISDDENMLNV